MAASALGRRYERLLFLAAPLALASALVLFVALAASNQQGRGLRNCLNTAAEYIDAREKIKDEWNKQRKTGNTFDYALALRLALIDADCPREIVRRYEETVKVEPLVFTANLRKEAIEVEKKPIAFGGVELPETTILNIFGLNIKIELMTLVLVLQVVLGPVLLVWLGSLHNTRFRETLLIGRAKAISELFPHLVNVYPVLYATPSLRKYHWSNKGIDRIDDVFAACASVIRAILMLTVVAPAVVFYLSSIYFLAGEQLYGWVLYVMGGIVLLFLLVAALAEFQPIHCWKTFPRPPIVKQE